MENPEQETKKTRNKNRTASERYKAWVAEIGDIVSRRYVELKEADQLAAAIKVQEIHKRILAGEIPMKEIQQAFEGDASNG